MAFRLERRDRPETPQFAHVDNPIVLVSNTGMGTATAGNFGFMDTTRTKLAQSFTTGSNADGYTLYSIGLALVSLNPATAGSQLTVTLNQVSGLDPGEALCELTDPTGFIANGVNTFPAPAICPTLTATTTYFVVLEWVSGTDPIVWEYISSTSEDSDSQSGWIIGDDRKYLENSTWETGILNYHKIEVMGSVATTPPLLVKNTAQTCSGVPTAVNATELDGQGFTTGANPAGYTLVSNRHQLRCHRLPHHRRRHTSTHPTTHPSPRGTGPTAPSARSPIQPASPQTRSTASGCPRMARAPAPGSTRIPPTSSSPTVSAGRPSCTSITLPALTRTALEMQNRQSPTTRYIKIL